MITYEQTVRTFNIREKARTDERPLVSSRCAQRRAELAARPTLTAPVGPVRKYLEGAEDRRLNAEQFSARQTSHEPTSGFYPGGYTPEELDDGRLDPVAVTASKPFVSVDQLPTDSPWTLMPNREALEPVEAVAEDDKPAAPTEAEPESARRGRRSMYSAIVPVRRSGAGFRAV